VSLRSPFKQRKPFKPFSEVGCGSVQAVGLERAQQLQFKPPRRLEQFEQFERFERLERELRDIRSEATSD
jgi:hypothetical protein